MRRNDDAEDCGVLRGAIRRFPVAVIAADENRMLRALNSAAERLFDEEALRPDLLEDYRTHPIAQLIEAIDWEGQPSPRQTLVFPSGKRYRVKVSARSERNPRGWLLLLIEPAVGHASDDELFDRWRLTAREREVARQLMAGSSTRAICHSVGIASNTFRTHVRRILEKSGAHSRSEFLAKVLG